MAIAPLIIRWGAGRSYDWLKMKNPNAPSAQREAIQKQVLLTSRELVDARPGFDPRTNEPRLNFRFNASGARTFGQVTQENVGRPFAFVFDREVLSAPVIRDPIPGGMGQMSGDFTIQQANDIAVLLRAGELPGRLTVIEQRTP